MCTIIAPLTTTSTITIEHYPNTLFALGGFSAFSVDINDAVKAKMKDGEELTDKTALSILESIKIKSMIMSQLSYPPIAIALAVLASGSGALLTITSVGVAAILGVALTILGLVTTGLIILCDNDLDKLSEAYSQQKYQATQYIGEIRHKHANRTSPITFKL